MRNYSTLIHCLDNGVLTLTLNRPEKLNAFTVQMADDLVDAFTEAGNDPDVGAVVVTGQGRAFCAGMDLAGSGNAFGLNESLKPTLEDMTERLSDPDIHEGVRDTGGRVTMAIYSCPKPVIAAINGAAIGIGATMTLAMDVRLASTQARAGFVFAKLGIVPEAASTWFLPRIVGMQNALDMMYSAEILTAADMESVGLVKAVYEPDELLGKAQALARRYIAGHSQVSLALIRQMMYRNSSMDQPLDAHRVESLAMFYTSMADGREGITAYREKRDPGFASRVPADLPPVQLWN